MRHTFCPRCDNLLDKNGHCSICGYQVKVRCHHCGHLNIPSAKYCGGCGNGTTLLVRYRNIVNSLLNPFQQIKVKRFLAGIAFGSLLALFAFSSMGMKYDSPNVIPNEEILSIKQENTELDDSSIVKTISFDLDNFMSDKDKTRAATSKEMTDVVNIMMKNFNYIANRINKKKYPLDSAENYLEQERCIKDNSYATRGNTALLFFAYLSDLLELKYKDYTQGSTYSDIPKFNIMDAPATALKKFNVKIAVSDERFGVYDKISVGELCDAAKQISIIMAQRANQEAPDLITPPEIIIE